MLIINDNTATKYTYEIENIIVFYLERKLLC